MTADAAIEALKVLHVEGSWRRSDTEQGPVPWQACCMSCGTGSGWPCETRRVLDQVKALDVKLTGIMCPPTLYPSLSLMAGPLRTGRGWMEINPELPEPSSARVLGLFALIGLFLVWAASIQPR